MRHPPDDLRELADFPDYGCTPDGHVWSQKSGSWRKLALSLNQAGGYLKVKVIDIDGKTWTMKVHALIAAALIGERPRGFDVNHKNGNKTDNRSANLEYLTRQQNVVHSIDVLGNRRVPCPDRIARRARFARATRMRRLSVTLWSRDGRRTFTMPAQKAMKLTDERVREIRERAATRTESRRKMAARLGISKSTVDRIISREKWAHVL